MFAPGLPEVEEEDEESEEDPEEEPHNWGIVATPGICEALRKFWEVTAPQLLLLRTAPPKCSQPPIFRRRQVIDMVKDDNGKLTNAPYIEMNQKLQQVGAPRARPLVYMIAPTLQALNPKGTQEEAIEAANQDWTNDMCVTPRLIVPPSFAAHNHLALPAHPHHARPERPSSPTTTPVSRCD